MAIDIIFGSYFNQPYDNLNNYQTHSSLLITNLDDDKICTKANRNI